MHKTLSPAVRRAGATAAVPFLLLLSACVAERGGYHETRAGPPVAVVYDDDYDYYPGYEAYYSRNRHEYVYRNGDAWVRRPELAGARPEDLRNAPHVHMDFHDSPEHHYAEIQKRYPRTWKAPASDQGRDRDHGRDHDADDHRSRGDSHKDNDHHHDEDDHHDH